MSNSYVARETRLSDAWAEVFLELVRPGITELAPVIVTVNDFDAGYNPIENIAIRAALDCFLKPQQSCRTVASTIFPNSIWRPSVADDAADLYSRYERIWPRIKKCALNRNGVYFRRLTAYAPRTNGEAQAPINQLLHIVETFRQGNQRHSALQASIFDPTRDHTHARQRGFPCLQQVAFGSNEDRLEITGFYALQHHITKSYGNYLGLCWLGRFMAHQMGLNLAKVTCVASKLTLGGIGKGELTALKEKIQIEIAERAEQVV